ncbi:hypothetical protein MLD38_018247 [Melastoma candidum]|uniref:Uncharacterized protein n=1 Tax=Melastoma candidum TaxID=119954 RepID=A0ACB9QWD2_9MYRT|nr:hypothetical protein MLD38_018247 [Melastoma candidum]
MVSLRGAILHEIVRVLPNIGYFEFIPVKEIPWISEQVQAGGIPRLLGLTEAEAGEEYEIIVTNFAGLYRYRLGDVVKVVGFHNATPELQFVCRSNLL